MQHHTIVGCGFVGRRIARHLERSRFSGLVRSAESARLIRSLGGDPQITDLDTLDKPLAVPISGAGVIYLAPPNGRGARDLRMERFVSIHRHSRPRRLVYLSTSGVYGDCDGEWVDESRRPHPVTARATRRWDAEQQLRRWGEATRTEVVVLRVGGIYARERLPEARLREGLTVVCPEDAPYTNRIHAEDLARVCLAALDHGKAGATYNVSDGHPTTMTDFFYRVADVLGLPRPPCVPLAEAEGKLSPAMLSYMGESRRLDTSRMLSDLRVKLRYPNLDSGLELAPKDTYG